MQSLSSSTSAASSSAASSVSSATTVASVPVSSAVVDQKKPKIEKIKLPAEEVKKITDVNNKDAQWLREINDNVTEYARDRKEYKRVSGAGNIVDYIDHVARLQRIQKNNSNNSAVLVRAYKVLADIYIQGEPQSQENSSSNRKVTIKSYKPPNLAKARENLSAMRTADTLAAFEIYIAEIKNAEIKDGEDKEIQDEKRTRKDLALEQLKQLANNQKPFSMQRLFATEDNADIAPLLAFYELCRLGLADEKCGSQISKQTAPLPALFEAVRSWYGIGKNKDVIAALTGFREIIQQALLPRSATAMQQTGLLACVCMLEICLDPAQKIPPHKQKEYCADAINLGLKAHRAGIKKRDEDYLLNRIANLVIEIQKKSAASVVVKDAKEPEVSIESNLNDFLKAGLDTPWTRFLRLALPQLLQTKQFSEVFFSLTEYMVLHKETYPAFTTEGLKAVIDLQNSLSSAEMFADTALAAAATTNYIPTLIAIAKQWRTLQTDLNKESLGFFIIICGYVYHAIKNTEVLARSAHHTDLNFLSKELETIKNSGVLELNQELEAQKLINGFKRLLPKMQTAITSTDAKVDSKNEGAGHQATIFEELAKLRLLQKEIQYWRTQSTVIEQRFFENITFASQLSNEQKVIDDCFVSLRKFPALARDQKEYSENTTNTTAVAAITSTASTTTSVADSVEGQVSKPPVKDQKNGDEKFELPKAEVDKIKAANEQDNKLLAEVEKCFADYVGNKKFTDEKIASKVGTRCYYNSKYIERLQELSTNTNFLNNAFIAIQARKFLARICILGEPKFVVWTDHTPTATGVKSTVPATVIDSHLPPNPVKARENLVAMQKINPLRAIDVYVAEINDEKSGLKDLATEQLKQLANAKTNDDDITPLLAFDELCRLKLADEKCGNQISKPPLSALFATMRLLYGIGRNADVINALTEFRKIVQEALTQPVTTKSQAALLASIFILEICADPTNIINAQKQKEDCDNAIVLGLKARRAKIKIQDEDYLLTRMTKLVAEIRRKPVTAVVASDSKSAKDDRVPKTNIESDINNLFAAGMTIAPVDLFRLALPLLFQQKQFTEVFVSLNHFAYLHVQAYPKLAMQSMQLLLKLQASVTIAETCLDFYGEHNYIQALIHLAKFWQKQQTSLDPDCVAIFIIACECVYNAIKNMSVAQALYCAGLNFLQQALLKIKELDVFEGEQQSRLLELITNFEIILPSAREKEVTDLVASPTINNNTIIRRANDYLSVAREALPKLLLLQTAIQDLQQLAQRIWEEVVANLTEAIKLNAGKVFDELKKYCLEHGLIKAGENFEPEETGNQDPGNFVDVIYKLIQRILKQFNVLDLVLVENQKLPQPSAPRILPLIATPSAASTSATAAANSSPLYSTTVAGGVTTSAATAEGLQVEGATSSSSATNTTPACRSS